jgi:hypothetical protein
MVARKRLDPRLSLMTPLVEPLAGVLRDVGDRQGRRAVYVDQVLDKTLPRWWC